MPPRSGADGLGVTVADGRQIADAARASRPDLKVLFITEFAENALLANGQLEPGMSVFTKPLVMEALAARVREMIARWRQRSVLPQRPLVHKSSMKVQTNAWRTGGTGYLHQG
jgi:DNA-binding response OmpR family regulator